MSKRGKATLNVLVLEIQGFTSVVPPTHVHTEKTFTFLIKT